MKNNLELLSPAGNAQGAFVAIANGADAVYLGAKLFNARKNAENFEDQSLKNICEYAHIFDKKVYLTVNTILENDAFEDLFNLIQSAIAAGVDAYIIQDLGVLQFIKTHFSGLELHASTQLAVHNVQGCKIAKQLGFKRVVLARETPLNEIKKIKEEVDIELEYFIQGALCVAFSGNCYLSACLKGESGNKGRCLQLCRLPYTASIGKNVIKNGYLLSAKDFNMSKKIKDLADAGVISFKIEGRARRVGYNAIVTSVYRKIIDEIFVGENNLDYNNINDQLKLAFNRGNFTEGYFNGNQNIIYDKIQGHIGKNVGKIVKFCPGNKFNVAEIASLCEIAKGDSYKIIRNETEVCTIAPLDIKLQNGNYVITTTAKMKVGDNVYKIVDSKLENELLGKTAKLQINMCLIARQNEKMKLVAQCNDICIEVYGENALPAQNQPATMQSVYDNLSRLSETEFELAEFMAILNNVFIKKQDLNNLRRLAVRQMRQEILKNYNQKFKDVCTIKQYNKTAEFEEICEKINKNCQKNTNFDEIKAICTNFGKNKRYFNGICGGRTDNCGTYNMFNVLFSSDIMLVKNNILKCNPKVVIANNISHFCILKEMNFNGIIIAGSLMNIANIYALDCICELGAFAVVMSPEVYENDYLSIKNNINMPIFKQNMQNMPLTTFVHCPIKNLYNCTCQNCKWAENIVFTLQSGERLDLCRVKLASCYFNLYKKID